jgi:hypothetical protein
MFSVRAKENVFRFQGRVRTLPEQFSRHRRMPGVVFEEQPSTSTSLTGIYPRRADFLRSTREPTAGKKRANGDDGYGAEKIPPGGISMFAPFRTV